MNAFRFELSKILDSGDWTNFSKPAIREIPRYNSEEEREKSINRLNRYKRIVIIDLQNRTINELGLQRDIEGVESKDSYQIIIIAGDYNDNVNIFNRLRYIMINNTEFYRRLNFNEATFTESRLQWVSTFTVDGMLVGTVLTRG